MAIYAVLALVIVLAIGGAYMSFHPQARCSNCGTPLPKPGDGAGLSLSASGRMICPGCGMTVDETGRIISS